MINPAEPGKTFEEFWKDLSLILKPGVRVGKFYGRAFVISHISDENVAIDSPDARGITKLPHEVIRGVYLSWRKYRYESLAHNNSQDVLHVVSIIEHVVQTWVRREERDNLIAQARQTELRDGVFKIVSYNNHGRIIGPSPVGELVSLKEVFPAQTEAVLSELESAATRLINAGDTNLTTLKANHPGFSDEVYQSVVYKSQVANR